MGLHFFTHYTMRHRNAISDLHSTDRDAIDEGLLDYEDERIEEETEIAEVMDIIRRASATKTNQSEQEKAKAHLAISGLLDYWRKGVNIDFNSEATA